MVSALGLEIGRWRLGDARIPRVDNLSGRNIHCLLVLVSDARMFVCSLEARRGRFLAVRGLFLVCFG